MHEEFIRLQLFMCRAFERLKISWLVYQDKSCKIGALSTQNLIQAFERAGLEDYCVSYFSIKQRKLGFLQEETPVITVQLSEG